MDSDDGEPIMFGATIPEQPRPAIQFRRIIAEEGDLTTTPIDGHGLFEGEFDAVFNEPPILPPSADYLTPFESWRKLGNDRYGNCVAVTWANMRRLVTSRLTGREVYPTMAQVMEVYRTQNPTLDPGQPMDNQLLLQHLVQKGGPDGVRAIAFAQVQHTSLNELRRALAIFGCLWIGLIATPQHKDEQDLGQAWTVPKSTIGSYGHAVLMGGYLPNANLKVVTWGQTAQLSSAYASSSSIYEAYVVIWPEHLRSRRFMKGINLNMLCREYRDLTGKDLEGLATSLNCICYTSLRKEFLQISILNPGDGSISDPKYSTPAISTVLPVSKRAASLGNLVMDNEDLYLIQTSETGSDYVEVSRVSGPSYYDFDDEKPRVTGFRCRASRRGIFTVDNGDLYFIKLSDTNSGCIEVYYAPSEKRFQRIDSYTTGFSATQAAERFTIVGGDLYLIVKDDRPDGFLEIHCARGNGNYSKESIVRTKTCTSSQSVSGVLQIGLNGDLYMIEHSDTESAKVEVSIMTALSNYQQVLRYITVVDAVVDPTRTWIV